MSEFEGLTPDKVAEFSQAELAELAGRILERQQDDRRENQILYYVPVSEKAKRIHSSPAKVLGVGGGNRSGKTETALVNAVARATGMIPTSVYDDIRPRFRGPINVRVVCESLTTVLHTILLPKLQWWKWTGIDTPGGARGHWGWVPRGCLKAGNWEKSWSEKNRTLTVLCRDPDNHERVVGESQFQFMSHDQDPSDFASGTFHIIILDEPPSKAIWIENQARVLDVNGDIYLVMTWPDDPSIPVDWIFDEVYEPGLPGPNKRPEIEWLELWTEDNRNLDREAIAARTALWSTELKSVKLHGQPIRFSNRIHPLFTDRPQIWCFGCNGATIPLEGICPNCGGGDMTSFCHVDNLEATPAWPCVFLIDVHPRKPHMFCWAQVDPNDDIQIIAEDQLDGDPTEVRNLVDEIEGERALMIGVRLMDPNMGRSPASARERGRTWEDEFRDAGLVCDMADDTDVGRSRLNEFLKPDPRTYRPRFVIDASCSLGIAQMKRYSWDDHRKSVDKDVKQKAREKYDDHPTMYKYLMNYAPTFRTLRDGSQVVRRPGRRKGY